MLNDAARGALIDAADENAAAWGCPAAGHKPHAQLPRHLTMLAQNAARVAGLDATPTTCPFACLQRCDPWVAELTRAAGIAADYHTPLPAVLGRDLTAADVEALDAMRCAQIDARESDHEIAEREREATRERP